MESWDIKRAFKTLYAPKPGAFELVEIPELNYLMIDGSGDPNTSPVYTTAVQTLYTVSYGIRAIAKSELDRIHTVGPLEGLWYADDFGVFTAENRNAWQWTMMIVQPEWITPESVSVAIEGAREKPGVAPDLVRFERLVEGLAVQILHIGPYRDEGPTIARLHNEYLPAHQLVPTGRHHEIYLSDPRKTVPEKLRTILRQPVERAS